MKKSMLLFAGFLFFCSIPFAQQPEDALRLSWTNPGGTAREQAIGGAMGSLGGEISAAFVNPAGLAFYKTGDFILSPGFRFLADKSTYRGNSTKGNTATNFNMGASGAVFGFQQNNGNNASFSIAVNQSAGFGEHLHYKGQNNYSSFAEQFAEEFSNSGLSIDDGISTTQLSYGTRMALYSYLIDTATLNGSPQVISQPLKAGLLNQDNKIDTRGGITEIALGYAVNFHDKWYVGGTLGIPIVGYTRNQTFTETDATGNTNNDFASVVYNETFTSRGYGLNLKLGVIYKPSGPWRVGLAIHSPTVYALKDRISSSMTTNTENYAHEISISSDALDNGTGTSANEIGYDLYSPWKFLLSGSYVFSESADVRTQKGFITADAGYTMNNTAHFSTEDNPELDKFYFDDVNRAIKSSYKGTFDFRVGGELKFNTIMARAGFAYYTGPYRDSELKASRMLISGGLGYRNKGMFIDLTYVQSFLKDTHFPYRLGDKANTFANINTTGGTVLLTVGFKFM